MAEAAECPMLFSGVRVALQGSTSFHWADTMLLELDHLICSSLFFLPHELATMVASAQAARVNGLHGAVSLIVSLEMECLIQAT